jgi:hypothetical protein
MRPMAYNGSCRQPAYLPRMKMFCKSAFPVAVVAAFASFLLAHPALSADAPSSGHLTIKRSANFGANLFLDIWIDGKKVQRLGLGHSYAASLAAGAHEIRAAVSSRLGGNSATAKLMVETGKSYQLTATWDGQQLVLK